jgi:hypothetical protein
MLRAVAAVGVTLHERVCAGQLFPNLREWDTGASGRSDECGRLQDAERVLCKNSLTISYDGDTLRAGKLLTIVAAG